MFVELVPTVEPAEAVETPAAAASAVLPRPAESAGSDAPTDGLAATDRGAVGEARAAEPEAALELLLGGGWRLLIRSGCGQRLLRRAVSALVPLRGVADARGTGPPVTGPPVTGPPGRRPAAFAAAEGEPC